VKHRDQAPLAARVGTTRIAVGIRTQQHAAPANVHRPDQPLGPRGIAYRVASCGGTVITQSVKTNGPSSLA
jgi:hypothetical protein